MSKEQKKSSEKREKGEKQSFQKDAGQMRLVLPKDLESKVRSESNPDAVVAEALTEFYSGGRSNSLIQKEVDNNIIEIQRRHISDLKEQLEAVNHNYDELMKTYQAYMLQVQPLIERAQLSEGADVKRILAAEENKETVSSEETKAAPAEENSQLLTEKKKKWYEFWK